jgi:hypothetical protein
MSKQKLERLNFIFRLSLIAMVFIGIVTGFLVTFGRPESAVAATNATLNFQARLLTAAGSLVPDGNYNVEFKAYNALSSSGSSQGSCSGDAACLWTETRISSDKVRVVNGYMTVNLGSVTAFSSTINWDQELWLSMRVGGTATPGWDGEMTPRLKLTGVPYAFRAGQLANTNGANQSTLGWATQTTSNSILLPNEAGTICLQSSSNCGFLTSGGAAGSFVQLQGSTPGTPQTGSLNISGTAIAGTALQSPIIYGNTLDTVSGTTTLNIGTTNASSGINLNQNTTVATNKSLTVLGAATFRAATDSPTAFQVQNSGNGQVLVVDTQNNFVRLVTGSITNITTASATGAVQIGGDATDNLALDDNEIMARTNGSASTLYVQKLGGGVQIQASNTIIKPNSDTSTTFQVQNNAAQSIFNVSSSGGSISLGQGSAVTGKMVLSNATNNNTVTIQSGTTSTGYTVTLPTALGANGDCLKDTTGTGVLGFGACGTGGGGGGGTLQNSYDNSGTASPQITLSTTNGGIKIRDAVGGVSGNLLQLQNAAGTATYFGLAATGLTLQDASGNDAFIFDTSTSHLRIYADGTSPTAYADIYYDGTAGEAVFTASTGTTRIGSGSGNITMQLSAAADVFQGTKAFNLSSAYSSNDFTFLRNINASGNALTGSVVKIESTSTGSGTVASNLLWINENNNAATGNLILATKNGAGNEKFKVDTAGSVTIASGQTFSSSSGALGISAGSGNLTLTAGGANTVIAKPGTNSATSFQVQNATSGALFTVDTSSNRLQVGSSTTDATGTILILDSYNQSGDPTGVNGGMYYNTNSQDFRAYHDGNWATVTPKRYAFLSADRTSSVTTYADVTDLSFSVAASTNYEMECNILYQTAATTTGVGLSLNGPTSPSFVGGLFSTSSGTTGGSTSNAFGAYDSGGATTGVTAANTNTFGSFKGYFRNGANAGTLQLRFRSEVASSNAVVKANSYCWLSEL